MKNFNENLFLNYEIGRSLDKEFIEKIYELFKKLNATDIYDDCHISMVSVIKTSDDTQIITYAFYKNNVKMFNLTFKLKNMRYLFSVKNLKGEESVKVSAPMFEQISDMIEIYLPDYLLVN